MRKVIQLSFYLITFFASTFLHASFDQDLDYSDLIECVQEKSVEGKYILNQTKL